MRLFDAGELYSYPCNRADASAPEALHLLNCAPEFMTPIFPC